MKPLLGVFSLHPRGFGFINCDNGKNFFVPDFLAKKFVDSDVLSFESASKKKISNVKLHSRPRSFLYGEVKDEVFYPDPFVSHLKFSASGLSDGWCIVDCEDSKVTNQRLSSDQISKIYDRAFARHDSARLISEVSECSVPEMKTKNLTDYSASFTFTVDDPSAEDLDDAISDVFLDDEMNVHVKIHIADPVPYLDETLDAYAQRRALTLYALGKVVPMLPVNLAHDVCSLKPGSSNRALSYSLKINPKGELVGFEVEESLVSSNVRLSYQEASALLEEPTDSIIGEIFSVLKILNERLSHAESSRGGWPPSYQNLDSSIRISDGKVSLSPLVEKGPAASLIERLMVLLNMGAARFMVDNELAGLFRSQKSPDGSTIAKIEKILSANGIATSLKDDDSPRSVWLASKALEKADKHLGAALQNSVRIMLPASILSFSPDTHYGLGLEFYATVTSPIRRYIDVWNARVIKAWVTEGVRLEPPVDLLENVESGQKAVRGIERDVEKGAWMLYLIRNQPLDAARPILIPQDNKVILFLESSHQQAILLNSVKANRSAVQFKCCGSNLFFGSRLEVELTDFDFTNSSLGVTIVENNPKEELNDGWES